MAERQCRGHICTHGNHNKLLMHCSNLWDLSTSGDSGLDGDYDLKKQNKHGMHADIRMAMEKAGADNSIMAIKEQVP